MIYYRLREDGSIMDFYGGDFPFSWEYLETDKKIILNENGVYVFEDEVDLKALEKANKEKELTNLKLSYFNLIEAELKATDYQCLKFVDGALTEEAYKDTKEKRAKLRSAYNELEQATSKTKVNAIVKEYGLV